MSGSKPIYFKLKRLDIHFLDSFKLIPIKLSKIPKALLNGEEDYLISKKQFPYKFLTAERLTFKGEYPSKEYFILDRKSPAELKEFDQWYETVRGTFFDLKKEITDYIFTDCLILYLGILNFQELVQEITKCPHLPIGCDPLQDCLTISALALKVFRQMDLTEVREVELKKKNDPEVKFGRAIVKGNKMEFITGNAAELSDHELEKCEITSYKLVKSSLAVSPPEHYNQTRRNNYSKEAMAYVLYYEDMLISLYGGSNVSSYHALCRGEACINLAHNHLHKCYLDGYFTIHTNSGTIEHGINFNGCWYVFTLNLFKISIHRLSDAPPLRGKHFKCAALKWL